MYDLVNFQFRIGVSRKSQKIGMHGVRISKVVATATVARTPQLCLEHATTERSIG